MKILETKRLILRAWEDKDLPIFAAMNHDPEVMEFFPALLSYEESANLMGRFQQQLKEQGFSVFAVELKPSGEFIGFVGLSIPAFTAHFTPCVEIGWRIATSHWNQGYATEAAKAVLHAAFTKFALKEVVSFTTAINKRSIHIMEKIGMHHDPKDDFFHPNIPQDHPLAKHVLYRLSADEYFNKTF